MRLIVQRLDLGQFFIRPKILEISDGGRVQMVQKFPGNVSRNGVDGRARDDSTFSNSSQAQLKQKVSSDDVWGNRWAVTKQSPNQAKVCWKRILPVL